MPIHPKVKRPVSVSAVFTAVLGIAAAFGVVVPVSAPVVAAVITVIVAVVGWYAPGSVTE